MEDRIKTVYSVQHAVPIRPTSTLQSFQESVILRLLTINT